MTCSFKRYIEEYSLSSFIGLYINSGKRSKDYVEWNVIDSITAWWRPRGHIFFSHTHYIQSEKEHEKRRRRDQGDRKMNINLKGYFRGYRRILYKSITYLLHDWYNNTIFLLPLPRPSTLICHSIVQYTYHNAHMLLSCIYTCVQTHPHTYFSSLQVQFQFKLLFTKMQGTISYMI